MATTSKEMPVVLKVNSDPLKLYALHQMGYPAVDVEITDEQLESAIRITGDFIAGYFPKETRLAVFYTTPLQATYPMPDNAYWIRDVSWDPLTTRIGDIFGAETYLFNVGAISSSLNILTDYHLLQAYRRTAQKVLGNEGHFEVINEVDGGPGDQLIRLYPTPKGTFPVVVEYMPVVNYFRSPQAKMIAHEAVLANAKVIVGMARRKMAGIPLPDGSQLAMDGDALVAEGQKEKDELVMKALNIGEPMGIYNW